MKMIKIKFLISIYCFLVSFNVFCYTVQIVTLEKNIKLFKNINLNSKQNICNILIEKINGKNIFSHKVLYYANRLDEIDKILTEFRYGVHTNNTILESCIQETEKKVKFSVERINPPVIIKNDNNFQLPKFDIYFEIIDGFWEITQVVSENCFSLLSETLEYRYLQMSEKYNTVLGYDPQFKIIENDTCLAHAKAVKDHFTNFIRK
nr:hypothetical protein GTC16762_24080 [Pigmentibacter ruber]